MSDEIREAFEAWYMKPGDLLREKALQRKNDLYCAMDAYLKWPAFQAGATWQKQQCEAEIARLREALAYAAQILPDAMAFIDRGLEKDAFNAISSVFGKAKQALKGSDNDQ